MCGESESCSAVSVSLQPHGLCRLPGFSVHGILQARILEFPSPGDLPNPGTDPRASTLQVDSFTVEPPGKPNYLWW